MNSVWSTRMREQNLAGAVEDFISYFLHDNSIGIWIPSRIISNKEEMELVPVPVGRYSPGGHSNRINVIGWPCIIVRPHLYFKEGSALFILRVGMKVVLLILLPIFLSFPIVFFLAGGGGWGLPMLTFVYITQTHKIVENKIKIRRMMPVIDWIVLPPPSNKSYIESSSNT